MTDYKLMPKQITKEMADAFWEEYSKDRADDLLIRCYKALYVTAPAPQPAPCRECGGDGAGGEHEDDCAMVQPEQPECGCCGQTVKCDPDCDAVILRKSDQQPAPQTEMLDDDSLARQIGEIGNQIHNLGCEHQNDEGLADRLAEIAHQAWMLQRSVMVSKQKPDVTQLVEALEELIDLMEDVRQGEYTPDSFTTQPARIALAAYRK